MNQTRFSLILSLLLILSCNVVWACESYEECMQDGKAGYHVTNPPGQTTSPVVPNKAFLQAIAYKLAEISKKLGPDPEELKRVIDLVNKEGGIVHGIDDK